MNKKLQTTHYRLPTSRGFSLVELLVSISIFLLFVSAIIDTTVGVDRQIKHASNIERASILAGEAIEVSRNIRDNNFNNLVDGTYGISTSTGEWIFLGLSDTQEIFERYLTISTVNDNQKKVDVNVSWSDIVSPTNSVSVSTYLTHWQKITPSAGFTVNKTVINHGKTSIASDFAPYKVGTTTIELAASTSFSTGTYIVSESNGSNYTTTFSGDCDSSGSVTLSPGDAKLCNITNEEKPSKIVVNKTVVNYSQSKTASDFTFFVDSIPVLSGDINTFDSGVHTVSETADINYTTSIGGDCNSSGSVTLVPNQTKVCTITNEENSVIPTVTTPTVTSISSSTATLGANVISLGAPSSISARGTCWSTSPSPVTNCLDEGGTTTGVFTQARTGFTASTTYYYRGYATNSTGTGYSSDGIFTTLPASCTGTPWGTMTSGTSNTAYLSASPAGACTSELRTCTNGVLSGSYTVISCTAGCTGTPWGSVSSGYSNTAYQSSSVTYPSSCTSETRTCTSGTLSGTYTNTSCSVTSVIPTVTTTDPTISITRTTASSGGNVTSSGGATVTARGVVWGTSINPTIALSTKTSDGSGTGAFTSIITSLTCNTLYHVRAYATNSVGTNYGSDVTFTTSACSAISYVGQATANTNTVTLPTHNVGDLMIIFAYRSNSNTPPTIPSGWTLINSSGASSNSSAQAYRIATGADTSGTWTNANQLVALVYRGASTTSPIGTIGTPQNANSKIVTYPAITLSVTDGSSWVVGSAGAANNSSNVQNAPTDMTARANIIGTSAEAAGFDTNGGVSTWTAKTVTISTVNVKWSSKVLEIKSQ